jgi:hypothetical protein
MTVAPHPFSSFPRKQETIFGATSWIPAFAGTTNELF